MKKLSLLFCLAFLFLSACAGQPAANPGAQTVGKIVKTGKGQYTDVNVAELQTMLKNKDFTFVNVHIPFEGNIAGTDVSIPYDTIAQHLDQLPANKNAKIFLYCRSGRMSTMAAETLVGLGYTNLYNLDGGFTAWEQAGLPIQK